MSGRLGEGHSILRDLERLGSKQARFTGDEHAGSDNPRDGSTIPAVRTSSTASATNKDSFGSSLSDVSQRLQRLEQQVRSQLTSKANTSPAPGQGRSALRQSLLALKDDVMSLAVSEVESQLLMQRLAALERAVARPSSAGPGWGLASDPGEHRPLLAALLPPLQTNAAAYTHIKHLQCLRVPSCSSAHRVPVPGRRVLRGVLLDSSTCLIIPTYHPPFTRPHLQAPAAPICLQHA
jgi:hypothetical protein